MQLRFGSLPILCNHARFHSVAQRLGFACEHSPARVFIVSVANPVITVERIAQACVGPAAEPAACGSALPERELVYQRMHFIGEHPYAFGIAEPHLEERIEPECDEPRHRLPESLC